MILVDPSPTEENLALSTHVFAFAFSGRQVGEKSSSSSEKKNKRRRTRNDNLEVDGMKMDQDLQVEDDEEDEEEETIGNGEKVELVFSESLGRVEMDLVSEIGVFHSSSYSCKPVDFMLIFHFTFDLAHPYPLSLSTMDF